MHKNKIATRDKPYVWIDSTPREDGMWDAFIFNYPKVIQFISMTAILENPQDCLNFSWGIKTDIFPAPEWLVTEIISRITKRFIYYYRQLPTPIQPNTQSDITT